MDRPTKQTRRTEAAEASKQAILDAAEELFAEKGYDAASLQDICDRAGITRGLPTYFFGSKEGLYRAVLERMFARSHELLDFLHDQTQQPEADPQEILRVVIARLFEVFATHPTFVRLTEWEALHGAHYLGTLPALVQRLHEAIQAVRNEIGWQGDAEAFLIALVALCWFPAAHAETFLKPLGVNVQDPDFRARYQQHLIDVLLPHAPERPPPDTLGSPRSF